MNREESIKKVRWGLMGLVIDKDFRDALETLIPELQESEDERIRKEIIEFIQWSEDRGMTRHDFHQTKRPSEWIAYLERQKEPSTDYFSTNHIETFPDGTTVRHTIGYLEKKDSSSDDYCKENCKGYQETGRCFFDEPCLKKKEWDKNLLDTDEEREKLKHEIWMEFKTNHINALKRSYWDGYSKGAKDKELELAEKEQKPEWSEEDDIALNNAIVSLSMYANGQIPLMLPSLILENVEQLKSLRDRGTSTCTPHWKPSEEQMEALRECGECKRCIKELYEDLQKRYGTC